MAVEVVLPQLGESVLEGTITKWLVKEGEVVSKEQPLVEVATDKADNEIPSPTSGTVVKIFAAVGTTVPVKGALCSIEPGPSASATRAAGIPSRSSPPPERALEALSPPAALAGTDGPAAWGAERTPGHGLPRSAFGGPLATPGTRKIARDLGVDAALIPGSGEHGRVTRDDVLLATRDKGSVTTNGSTPPTALHEPAPRAQATANELQALLNAAMADGKTVYVPPIPNVGFGAFKVPPYMERPGDRLIPFTRRRRLTAAHMVYSKQVAPQVVTVAEVDLQATVRLRDAHKDRYKKEGVGLTYLAFIVHATAIALKENPAVNARVLEDAYVVLRDINIGVAVDTKDGLVVPVLRRVDGLNVRGIAQAIDDAAVKARDGKLAPDDLAGATFSVSNPGLKGNMFGGAIISQPNVGILRIGELKKRVVVVEAGGQDTIAIHPVMYLALSYDHRVVDGVAANAFLWRIRELLEKGDFEV